MFLFEAPDSTVKPVHLLSEAAGYERQTWERLLFWALTKP